MLLDLDRPVELSCLWRKVPRSQQAEHRRECLILGLRVSGTRDHNNDGDDNPVARNTTSRTSRCPTPYPICKPAQPRLVTSSFAASCKRSTRHVRHQKISCFFQVVCPFCKFRE